MPGLSRSIAESRAAEKRRERTQADLREQQMVYRIRMLPEQIERARNRVAMLEKEAAELGMRDLLA